MDINKSELISAQKSKHLLIILFFLLLASSFFVIPNGDSFYYWEWGRHLALSYFDGPPMIAYAMRFFNSVFGHYIHAINFLGLISLYVTLFFIYKSSKLIVDDIHFAAMTCLLWILSPLIIQFLFLSVTYDNALVVTWAASIYFIIRYITFKKTIDIYFIGLCFSLLMLSKYTGIILIISFLIFMILNPKQWAFFLNKHSYFSAVLSLGLFSPVIFWNFQHDWISFTYQLKAHVNTLPPFVSLCTHFTRIVEQLNLLLIAPIVASFFCYKDIKKNECLQFLYVTCFFTVLFFLYLSLHHKIAKHWLLPITISNVIIYSYILFQFRLRKLFLLTFVAYLGISIFFLISYLFFHATMDKSYHDHLLVIKSRPIYDKYRLPVVTTTWRLASSLAFFLPNKPQVYALGCGPENEYNIWSEAFLSGIRDKKINEVLYFDYYPQSNKITTCINKIFTNCELLQQLTNVSQKTTNVRVYRCYN